MSCYGCRVATSIIGSIFAILIISILISGILGYFGTTEEDCIVTSCNDTALFYKSENQTIAHIGIQLNKDTKDGIFQMNDNYYDVRSDCSQIPDIVKCYPYQGGCYRSGCVPGKLSPVRQLDTLWPIFGLTMFIPVIMWVMPWVSDNRGCCYCCNCNCCSNIKCLSWKKYGKNILLGVSILYCIGIICLMGFGIAGFLDNVYEKCLVTSCALEPTVDNSRIMNATKITIQSNQFDSWWKLHQPQYTYLNKGHSQCSQIDETEPCYYTKAKDDTVNNERIQNSSYGMLVMALIPEIFIVLVYCIT